MWFFNKKQTIAQSHLLTGGCDHHTHILPGVDDGISTIEEALQTLSHYEKTGIKEVWLTPHIMEDFPNTPAKLQERYAALTGAYTGNITLHLAAEYMIDNLFNELMETNDLLPIGENRNHLLVETSYFTPPMQLQSTLRHIKSKGYHPLLAHPERYLYMDNSCYKELHEMGVKFQLNLLSLAGGYGRTVQKKAEWLLQHKMYTVAGSDLHHPNALEILNDTAIGRSTAEQLRTLLNTSL